MIPFGFESLIAEGARQENPLVFFLPVRRQRVCPVTIVLSVRYFFDSTIIITYYSQDSILLLELLLLIIPYISYWVASSYFLGSLNPRPLLTSCAFYPSIILHKA